MPFRSKPAQFWLNDRNDPFLLPVRHFHGKRLIEAGRVVYINMEAADAFGQSEEAAGNIKAGGEANFSVLNFVIRARRAG